MLVIIETLIWGYLQQQKIYKIIYPTLDKYQAKMKMKMTMKYSLVSGRVRPYL